MTVLPIRTALLGNPESAVNTPNLVDFADSLEAQLGTGSYGAELAANTVSVSYSLSAWEGAIEPWMHGAWPARTVLANLNGYKTPPKIEGMPALREALFGVSTTAGQIHLLDGATVGSVDATANIVIEDSDGIASFQMIAPNTGDVRILAGDQDASASGRMIYDHSSDSWRIWTNGSEKMRITGAGEVGIGIAPPAVALHVADNSNAQMRIESTTGNARMQYSTLSYQWSFGVNEATGRYTINDGTDTVMTIDPAAGADALYVDASGVNTSTGAFKVNDTQVVGARGAAITDAPAGGSATAADNAVAINAILTALRAHGLIAP